ncbi:MAG: hypothetical protein U5P41_10460 [Gammaproteobacteria bacterium]|nr:hypothetical protein [Gammaproteobacteria bacterium]
MATTETPDSDAEIREMAGPVAADTAAPIPTAENPQRVWFVGQGGNHVARLDVRPAI